MRLTQNQLALIADIYDAAIRPSQWVELLDRLVPEVGAKGSALLSIEALGQYHYSISETSSLYSSEVKSTYEREYSRFEESHFANVARSEPRTLVFDEERSRDPESFFRRKDVSYLRETCGVYERFAVKLNDDPAWFDCLTFQYDKSRGNIEKEERDRLFAYVPHVAQTVSLSKSFAVLKSRFNAVLGVLDRFRIGVFLVTARMQVIVGNRSGWEIADQRKSLLVSDRGILGTRSAAHHQRLVDAVRKACATSTAEGSHEATLLAIPGNTRDEDLCVEVSAIRDAEGEIDRFRGAVVFVIDPCAEHEIQTFGLSELYGLTKSELEVSRHMIAGRTCPEIADARHVSPETVKSQIRSTLAKTRSRNRAEFLRRVFSMNPPIDPSEKGSDP